MGKLYDELAKDYRLKEGLKTCINCGTCTAICPAAEFYKYDPRKIVDTVQRQDLATQDSGPGKARVKTVLGLNRGQRLRRNG